jgi:hypothetical protein
VESGTSFLAVRLAVAPESDCDANSSPYGTDELNFVSRAELYIRGNPAELKMIHEKMGLSANGRLFQLLARASFLAS